MIGLLGLTWSICFALYHAFSVVAGNGPLGLNIFALIFHICFIAGWCVFIKKEYFNEP